MALCDRAVALAGVPEKRLLVPGCVSSHTRFAFEVFVCGNTQGNLFISLRADVYAFEVV